MISFVFTELVCSLIEKKETPIKYLHLLAFSGQSFTHVIIKYFAQKSGNPLFSSRIFSFSRSLKKILHILLSNILLKKEEIS